MDEDKDEGVRPAPPAGYVAAGMVGLIGLGVLGWMIYRSRRRRTLMKQLRDALPERVRALPERVRRLRSG